MWLSTLQYAWSFLFYCGVTLVFITAVGACKKLSQDKGKTYAHLSAAVAANAPQWRAVLADTTQPQQPLIAADDRRRRDDDSSSYETEDEAEEERRERAREREREREKQRLAEREKERERGREEKEREKRRRDEESDEASRPVGVPRRRRRPLSAAGGVFEAENEQLVAIKGSSGQQRRAAHGRLLNLTGLALVAHLATRTSHLLCLLPPPTAACLSLHPLVIRRLLLPSVLSRSRHTAVR